MVKEQALTTEFEYQESGQYFAQIAGGLEEEGARELEELGATNISTAYRGIHFQADQAMFYRINYCSRLASRILAPLKRFACPDIETLKQNAAEIDWNEIFDVNRTFAIFANVANSRITHSKFAALSLKDTIVDQFRDRFYRRPDVDPRRPDVAINLFIDKDQAVLSIDASGGAMNRRGYRRKSISAPMQETVAAAIIRMTEWHGSMKLHDPMCGSGTLLAEALMHACAIPSGHLRKNFGLEYLPDYNESLWKKIRESADSAIKTDPAGLISGSDIAYSAISASKSNLRVLPGGSKIKLRKSEFDDHPGLKNGVILTNPPYGIRMGEEADMPELYSALGNYLKQRCQGSVAYVYFGERALIREIGLKPAWKKPLISGALDGRLVKFELY